MSSRRRFAPHERRFVQLLVAVWLGVLTTYLMVIADEEGGTAAAALISGVLAVRLAWGPFTESDADSRPRVESLRYGSGDTPDPAPQHIARPPSDEKPR